MKKIIKSFILCLFVTLLFTCNVFANTNPISYYWVDGDYVDFITSNSDTYNNISWQHYTNNPTGIEQTLQYEISREKYASTSATCQTTIDAMFAELEVGIEVSFGMSETETVTRIFNIPPYSSYLLVYGSKVAYVSGYEYEYENFQLVDSRFVSGTWTYAGYDDMILQ